MKLSGRFSGDNRSFEPVAPSDKSLPDKGNYVCSMLFIIFTGDLNIIDFIW